MKTDTKQDKEKVLVALFTPYLYKEFPSDSTPEEVAIQTEKFGYDPKNFSTERCLDTPRYLVHLETAENHTVEDPTTTHFAIAGSTESGEDHVARLRGTGLMVARYSIFYGGASEYTGRKPEDTGYAFDIPKKVSAVKALLQDESVLEALVSREEGKIRSAIDTLNETLEAPILITPYLTEALSVKR